MNEEPEYYSIHQEIADQARRNANSLGGKCVERKVVTKPLGDPLDDIRASLKILMDQVANINAYIRNNRNPGKMYYGEATKREIIRAFLQEMAQGKYTQEEIKQLTCGDFTDGS